jgi:nucleoside 2-deoxyribosyltransferase
MSFSKKRIYLASSWRNPHQPWLVELLRQDGHEVYDFRNPPNSSGFKWQDIGLDPANCTAVAYREALLQHPRAAQGFMADFAAMRWADTGLLVLPCGRSAHLELGWLAGAGKRTLILTEDGQEPELMALLADRICVSVDEVRAELR